MRDLLALNVSSFRQLAGEGAYKENNSDLLRVQDTRIRICLNFVPWTWDCPVYADVLGRLLLLGSREGERWDLL